LGLRLQRDCRHTTTTHPGEIRLRIEGVDAAETARMTPSIYPTRVTHLHRSPVHHYAEHRSYSWHVDVDALPELPRWVRPFARFDATDHLDGSPHDSLRQRVDAFLARHDVSLPGGRVTALLMPRVLGKAFNPLSLFWCHDAGGALRCVIADVQTTGGERHTYLLPPGEDGPVAVTDTFDNAPFSGREGYFLVRVPEPIDKLDLTVSLHRDNQAALVATWRGSRRRATAGTVLRMQFSAPLAPHMAELSLKFQAAMLRLRGVAGPVRQRGRAGAPHPVQSAAAAWTANSRSWAPS
jgi:DUF1365 family protein